MDVCNPRNPISVSSSDCNLIAAGSSRTRDLETHSVNSNVVHVDLAALDVVEDVGSSSDAELSHAIGLVVEVVVATTFLALAKEFSYIFKVNCVGIAEVICEFDEERARKR